MPRPSNKIHFHLQTFKDINPLAATKYWAEQLEIPITQITTCKPIPPQGKGSYRKINQHGVMTVAVYNTHFRDWMMEQLSKLGYNPE